MKKFQILITLLSVLFSLQFSPPVFALNRLEIRKDEILIEKRSQDRAKKGFAASDFFDRIIEKLDGNEDLNNEDRLYIKDWDREITAFHGDRFILAEKKQTYFLSSIHRKVKSIVEKRKIESRSGVSPLDDFTETLDIGLENRMNTLDGHFSRWKAYSGTLVTGFRDGIGQEVQKVRIHAFLGYFKELSKLLTSIGHPIQFERHLSLPPVLPMLNLSLNTIAQNWIPGFSSVMEKNSTPFTQSTDNVLNQWTHQEGFKVIVNGRDNLEVLNLNVTEGRPSEVNLFLPAHRAPNVDALILAKLDLPHYIVFANPGSFMPWPLANEMASRPDVIGVGKARGWGNLEPHRKILESLGKGISPNVVNYPQGFIGSTGEILPIHSRFLEKLLVPLIRSGYRVNVIPVTYEVDSEFLAPNNLKGHSATATFHRPLRYQAVQEMVRMQLGSVDLDTVDVEKLLKGDIKADGPKIFDNYLMTQWYENIRLHKEFTLDQLFDRLNRTLNL